MKYKLYKLKSWLTLEEAASHLSSVLSESVEVSDILQLAIEKRLKLSVNILSPAYANEGVVFGQDDVRVMLSPSDESLLSVMSSGEGSELGKRLASIGVIRIKDIPKLDLDIQEGLKKFDIHMIQLSQNVFDTEYVEFGKEVVKLFGIYDLPMISAEGYEIEDLYYRLVGGPEVERWSLEGAWLEGQGVLYRLCTRMSKNEGDPPSGPPESMSEWRKRYKDKYSWFPIDRLPEESTIVVRRHNLDEFILSLGDEAEGESDDKGSVVRHLESFGLLVELYTSQHGPDYRNGIKPKASRIVEDMLAVVPDEVTSMGDRKLKEHVGAAIKAWEAKKRR